MDKSDFLNFVIFVRWNCTILRKTTGLNEDMTGLSGEYVTFDQKGKNAFSFSNFYRNI